MRRIGAFTLTLLLLLGLASCGRNAGFGTGADSAGQEAVQRETEQSNTESAEPAAVQRETESNRPLVIYFSAADNDGIDAVAEATKATWDGRDYGAVQLAAEWIQGYTGADIFSIVTREPYSDVYEQMADTAKEQQDRNVHPALVREIPHFENYDTVFLAYPIWWYHLPMPVDSLLDDYDFSGKTILPLALHAGSRFSGTIEEIAAQEPDAVVVEDGFTLEAESIHRGGESGCGGMAGQCVRILGVGQRLFGNREPGQPFFETAFRFPFIRILSPSHCLL